ncbi:MAG: LamG domain-containing protein [Chloracidobacterium sp.]|nr:LamG domain-containing protein [Chloracidobacterium sp.]
MEYQRDDDEPCEQFRFFLPPTDTALQFDGVNDYVTFGSAAGTAAPGLGVQVFTVETWFKRTGAGVTTTTSAAGGGGLLTAIPLVTKGRGEGDGSNVDKNYWLGIDSATNVLVADFEECNPAPSGQGCPLGGTAGLNHAVFGTTTIQNNIWYHAAATYDGQVWNLYLNGVLDKTLNIGANRLPRWDSIQHAGIGTAMTSTGATAGFFQGIMDEVRIWNVVRNPDRDFSGHEHRTHKRNRAYRSLGFERRFWNNRE